MAEIEELKTNRNVIKSQLTRQATFVNKFTPDDVDKLEVPAINMLYKDFNELQGQVEKVRFDKEEEKARDDFENKYFRMRCLKELAVENKNKYVQASSVILQDFFVDDLLLGGNTIQKAKDLRDHLIEIFVQAKFNLCKWSSNCFELLAGLSDVISDKSLINLDPTMYNKTRA
ncbi:hypothetical protein ILUMI_22598 [Ignelater luminosus]|uniref:Uncharacterized protein n=1 Tax=Ignelater luminosus TaxID=2038154 RepID=A0A8K0C9U6_IGNLU|nr:hypothetical protein ILUMI_22598 [Ignelater luminosus]